jgi:dihydrofolate reductase
MNETPKIVFSESADWPESRIARGELAQKIADLKRESDKDLIAWGGALFAQSLAREGLIDVYRLTTHPVAVANGEPLFKDLKAPARLKLVESKMFESATMNVFEPA